MMKTNLESYESDFNEIVVLFDNTKQLPIVANFEDKAGELCCAIDILDKHYDIVKKNLTNLPQEKFIKRFAKISLYQALSDYYNKSMPWGALTGVHPSAIAHEYYNRNNNYNTTRRELIRDFLLSEAKADLVIDIIKNQRCIINNPKDIDIYVHIPFCNGRCTYCTFFSNDINKCSSSVDAYIEALIVELEAVKEMVASKFYVVRSIYIGGGTPTALTAQQLRKILACLKYHTTEFTVECGRADSITEEKLQVLKDAGVTRISINPQTFCDKTLKLIGRRHTVSQVIEAYKLALKYNFDINMDLIAGLPNETMRNFKKSIDMAVEFAPANITVHTLSLKRGNLIDETTIQVDEVGKMVDYASTTLRANDYQPYYLYRQKRISGGHENVGYCKSGKACIYNIDSIEESSSIIAVGSGAISKKVGANGNIVRQSNSKDLLDYIYRVSEYIAKKTEIF